MAFILALDPDRRQNTALQRVGRELDGHELCVVESCTDALAAMDRRVPHLVLLPSLLPEGQENELLSRLRTHAGGASAHALTIPLLRSVAGGCEPRVFADQIREYLESGGDDGGDDAFDERPVQQAPPLPLMFAVPKDRAHLIAAANAAASWARARRATWQTPSDQVQAAPVSTSASASVSSVSPASSAGLVRPAEAASVRADVTPSSTTSAVARSQPSPFRAPEIRPVIASPAEPEVELVPVAASVEPEAGRPTARRVNDRMRITPAFTSFGLTDDESAPPDALGEATNRAREMWVAVGPWLPGLFVLVLVLTGGLFAYSHRPMWMPLARAGTVELQSNPTGSQVVLDGHEIGQTPTTATLPAGPHKVEFRLRKATRSVQFAVAAGGHVVRRVDWTRKATGGLRLVSDPVGAHVLIDGADRGVTPLTVGDLPVGPHAVVLQGPGGVVQRSVTIEENQTAQISEGIFAGFVAVLSPFDVSVAADGHPLRLDDRNQAMLSPGTHEIRIASRALGYQDTQQVRVEPGKTTVYNVVPPQSAISVSATEPADVWIDGASVGQAPLVGLPVDLGLREVLVKSAAGETRRFTITVTVKPVDLAVDFAKSPDAIATKLSMK
jgi:hypothetical protein